MRHLCVLLLLLVTAASGQTGKADWSNVKQLRAGERIKVVLNDGKSSSGVLENASDDGIVVSLSSSETTFVRADVRRILVKGQSRRRRNALIGAAIGAAAGLGLGAALDQQCAHSFCASEGNTGKAIGTPGAGVLGAAIGALLPTGRWHEVYRVVRRENTFQSPLAHPGRRNKAAAQLGFFMHPEAARLQETQSAAEPKRVLGYRKDWFATGFICARQ
jgi:hypothetical protein